MFAAVKPGSVSDVRWTVANTSDSLTMSWTSPHDDRQLFYDVVLTSHWDGTNTVYYRGKLYTVGPFAPDPARPGTAPDFGVKAAQRLARYRAVLGAASGA